MALPTHSSMPAYVIYRETRPGQPVDPTTPPVFFPPKDSDELFDALRAKFPNVRTHSERMRDAIIEFLLEERQAEQQSTISAPPSIPNSESTSPWQQSWPSVSASTLSSPEAMTAMTPMFSNSPRTTLQPPHMGRQFSTSNSIVSSEPSPPAIENMTTVFSLSSTEQPKQRVRRKMTEAEKVEYRKRRIVKACDKCSKRKRKCHHNQPEMDHVSTKSRKVTKLATPDKKPSVGVPTSTNNTESYLHTRDDSLSFSLFDETQTIEDFTTLLDLDHPNVDPFQPDWLATDGDWHWSASGDFTLIDDLAPEFDYSIRSGSDSSSQQSPSCKGQQLANPHQHSPWSQSGSLCSTSSENAVPWQVDERRQHPTETSCDSVSSSNSNAMLWEHLRTGQDSLDEEDRAIWHDQFIDESDNRPQHTYHAHLHTSCAAFMHDGAAGSAAGIAADAAVAHETETPASAPQANVSGGPALASDPAGHSEPWSATNGRPGVKKSASRAPGISSSSIRKSTLQLSGIARAVRRFGSLLDSQSPTRSRLMSVSLLEIAPAVRQSSMLRALGHSGTWATTQNGVPTQTEHASQERRPVISESVGGPLEIMQIRDYLRMKTNTAAIEQASSNNQLLGLEQGVLPEPQPCPRQGTPSGLAMNSAPGSSRAMLQNAHSSAARPGRSALSLGGTSLDGVAAPDLYLLRKGLSREVKVSALQLPAIAAMHKPPLMQRTPQALVEEVVAEKHSTISASPCAHTAVHTRSSNPRALGFCIDNSHLMQQQDLGLLVPRMSRLSRTSAAEVIPSTAKETVVCNSIAAILRAKEGWFPDFLTCLALLVLFFACGCDQNGTATMVTPSVLLLALLCPAPTASRKAGTADGERWQQALRLPKLTSLLHGHARKFSLAGIGASSSPWWNLALASVKAV